MSEEELKEIVSDLNFYFLDHKEFEAFGYILPNTIVAYVERDSCIANFDNYIKTKSYLDVNFEIKVIDKFKSL